MVGATLVTVAGFTWLFVLPTQLRGYAENPHAGIMLFIILPVLFIVGLALIPIGAFLARRHIRTTLDRAPLDRQTSLRRLGIFVVVATILNVILGTQLTYRAVEHMEPRAGYRKPSSLSMPLLIQRPVSEQDGRH